MSICWNWKVLQMMIVFNTFLGLEKEIVKASFRNGWSALFQHFGSETFLVFILKLLSIYFFIILCAITMTQNQGKLRHDVCLLKVNWFELPERSCFLISSDMSWICSDWASGPILKSTRKWAFYPPQNLWGHEDSETLSHMSPGAAKMKTSYQRHAIICLDNMVLIPGGSLGRQRDHSRENGRKKVGKLSFIGASMNKRGWRGSRRGAGWNHKAHQPREEAGDNPRRVQTQQIPKSKTKLSWNICP